MRSPIRLFMTALLAVALMAVAAVVVGYRLGAHMNAPGFDVASTGDLRGLFSGSDGSDSSIANLALRRLEYDFYKPIVPQTPLAGEAAALRSLLSDKKVAHAQLPAETATGDSGTDGTRAADLLSYAQAHYATQLGSTGSDDLTDAALRGMMNSVHDPYTVYLSPREIQGLQESLSGGNFGGIGVYIFSLRDGRVIVQPIDDLPAARAGMKPGDIIDSVDGRPVRGLALDKVEGFIRGETGTTVHVRAHPYNSHAADKTYAIVRAIILVPTVHAKMEGNVDYIRLSDFGKTSPDEIRKALLSGKAHGAHAYILDLRDNGGGYLDAAVSISSLFVPQGTIVSTIRRDGERTSETALGDALGGLHPLVILVNKYTASASEITSGALQDYHLATLLGTRTFGKGVVQSIFQLPDGGALKITTARYLTPAGRDIQHHGIQPDIEVEQDPNPALFDTSADKQLAAAKAFLKSYQR